MYVYITIDSPMFTKGKPYKIQLDYTTNIVVIDNYNRPHEIHSSYYTVVTNNSITNREFYLEDYSNSIPN